MDAAPLGMSPCGSGLQIIPSVRVSAGVNFGVWRYTYGDPAQVVRELMSSPAHAPPAP
eukprot:SAG11_NODE_870_length_6811_cov_36.099508_1_plen_57_part_10